ncbi:MAG: acyltransferase [Dehalococcoidia bacterium]|jgi:peptidoglycan/LPS O-acetylase OafA/YrhL
MDTSERRFDLDWVRVITILVVFVFHCGRFFDSWPWHLKNSELFFPAQLFNDFADLWQMPVMFLVSGAAAWFSLRSRRAGNFINERVGRLLIPLAFGILVIVPPQVYLERIYKQQFDGSFFAFYPHFFQGTYSYTGTGNFSWHHLWFLAYLFIITLIALPGFLFLNGPRGKKLVDGLASFVSKPGAILAWFLPLALCMVSLQPLFPNSEKNLVGDMAFFSYYLFSFVFGYLFCMDRRFWEAIERHAFPALALAAATSAALAYLEFSNSMPAIGYSAQRFGSLGLWTLCGWCWILTLLGMTRKFLSFSNRFLSYANEAVLPFYILHHMVIIGVGFYVIQWDIPVLAKYLIIIAISFAIIMLLYQFVVKRTNVTRFLFGMRTKRRGGSPVTAG